MGPLFLAMALFKFITTDEMKGAAFKERSLFLIFYWNREYRIEKDTMNQYPIPTTSNSNHNFMRWMVTVWELKGMLGGSRPEQIPSLLRYL